MTLQAGEFYAEVIQKLVPLDDKRLKNRGDYVEKYSKAHTILNKYMLSEHTSCKLIASKRQK